MELNLKEYKKELLIKKIELNNPNYLDNPRNLDLTNPNMPTTNFNYTVCYNCGKN